jgi:crotonobetainyl-CoA:carnitine CoA-transferase CaiB-like acyl-CoA transferase
MDGSIKPGSAGKGLAKSAGALAGIKVVDLTRVLGGPYCTMILSDHGADVIKVEPPQGDEVRDWGPPFHEGDASYFIGVNRNKRAIALDLGKPEGRRAAAMLEDADVLIENFKPGDMEKWGLGYHEVLSKRFPRPDPLPHLRLRRRRPLGGLPGYDAILQAMTGLMSVNGDAPPARCGWARRSSTWAPGLYSAIGILMALHERNRLGAGPVSGHDACTIAAWRCCIRRPPTSSSTASGPHRDRQSASQPGALRQVPHPHLRHLHRQRQ